MAPEHIPTALECFGQIDRELSRKYEGAGLGLPLPKHPVELHGATLTIASELVARLLQSCFLLSACSLSAKSPEHSFSCRRKPQKTLNSYELNFYRISERGNSAISPNGGSRRSGYFTGAKMSAFFRAGTGCVRPHQPALLSEMDVLLLHLVGSVVAFWFAKNEGRQESENTKHEKCLVQIQDHLPGV
jgi:signal transduction histidine kinase